MRAEKVGIFAPYTWCEKTFAAIRLAELIRELGLVPTWWCNGPKPTWRQGQSLHGEWDKKVIFAQRDPTSWLERQRAVIWLDHRPDLVAYARRHGTKNILVPSVGTLGESFDLNEFDVVACPTRDAATKLEGRCRAVAIPGWDAGAHYDDRSGPRSSRSMSLLVVPEYPMPEEHAILLLFIVRTLSDMVPALPIRMVQLRQWSKGANNVFRVLLEDRVTRAYRPSYEALQGLYFAHDWVLYLPYKVSVGVQLAMMKSLGNMVLSWSLPAVREFFWSGYSSILLPQSETIRASEPIRTFSGALLDRRRWYEIKSDEGDRCATNREQFTRTWGSLLMP